MAETVQSRQEKDSWVLWLKLLAGPLIWATHFLMGYLLVEAFCETRLHFTVLGINGLSFLLVTTTILALIGSSYFGFQTYRNWGNMNPGKNLKERLMQSEHWTDEAAEFMYFSGFLLSVLFTATILVVGLPVLFLRVCA